LLKLTLNQTLDMGIGELRIAILNHIVSKQLNKAVMIIVDDSNNQNSTTSEDEDKDYEALKLLNLFSIDYKTIIYQGDNVKYYSQMATGLPQKDQLEKNHDYSDFKNAVDDMLYDISTIITDEEYITNSKSQTNIRQTLGYEKEIKYIHIPSILDKKNDEKSSSVNWLLYQGYLPAAIANYLVQLGYNTPVDIFTLEEAIEWFDINKISSEAVELDIDKLNMINKEYIIRLDDMRLSKLIGYADDDIGKLSKLYISQCNTLKQIKSKIDTIFTQKTNLDNFQDELVKIQECIRQAPFINNFKELQKYIMEYTQLKEQELSIPLRYALTGDTSGPNLSDIYPFIKNYLGEIV